MQRLTEKQKRFIDFFIQTGNQTEAARLAGYKSPHVQGAQNYEKLRKFIDERLAKIESNRIAKDTEVMQYLTAVLRGEETEKVLIGLGEGAQGITDKQVMAKERIKAAELLGKRYGLFTDNVNISGEMGVQIVNDVPAKEDD